MKIETLGAIVDNLVKHCADQDKNNKRLVDFIDKNRKDIIDLNKRVYELKMENLELRGGKISEDELMGSQTDPVLQGLGDNRKEALRKISDRNNISPIILDALVPVTPPKDDASTGLSEHRGGE